MPGNGISASDEIQHFFAKISLKAVIYANDLHLITKFKQTLHQKSYTGKSSIENSPTL